MNFSVRNTVFLTICLLLMAGQIVAQRTLKMNPVQPKTATQIAPQTVETKQQVQKPAKSEPKPAKTEKKSSGEKTLVYLENAETFSFDKDLKADAQLLKGAVRFRHDDAVLYCDSAYFYEGKNAFDAYGHVKIVQGDTLFIYGDVLYYDGDTKLARLRHNVRMNNREVTLVTDSLNYDRAANVGYYFTGGKLYDEENVLTSVFGHYYPGQRMALFRRDVLLTNPNFTMTSDTLKYFTETSLAEIVGPTTILYANETTIYSELGIYDTKTEQSQLLLNSWVKHQDGQKIIGDTIFYDKKNGIGRAFSNVELNDSAKQISLFGNFVYYKEEGDVALAHDSALMVEYSSTDTLYLNADTLYSYAVDSVDKIVQAFYHVRVFRRDVQAVCDSASYETRDSVMHLMKTPVAWSGNRQITGDTMHIYSLNGEVERMHVNGAAFVAEQQDSFFNQMSGKELIAYIADRGVRQIDVRGNAESIYFPLNEDSVMIGLNHTESSYLTAYLVEQKIERIVLYPSPTALLTPMEQITSDMEKLPGFSWYEPVRPEKWQDVYARPEMPKQETVARRRRSGRAEEEATETAQKDGEKSQQNSQNMPARFDGGRGSSQPTMPSFGGGSKTTLKTNTNR